MQIRKLPRIVPWINHEEKEYVKSLLFNSFLEERVKGISHIKMWSLRGNIPIAVEITSQIIEALDNEPFLSATSFRFLLSSIFIRFVNGMLDPYQKSLYARSLTRIAEEIGFPRYFVDLRHDATHSDMPSLDLLKSSCKHALKWLKENFWDVQKDVLEDCKVQAQIKNIKEDPAMQEKLDKLYSDLSAFKECVSEVVVPILLEPGFIVPSNKRKRTETAELQVLFNMWLPILEALQTQNLEFLFYLMEQIISYICNYNEDTKEKNYGLSYSLCLTEWVLFLVQKFNEFSNDDVSDIYDTLKQSLNTASAKLMHSLLTSFDFFRQEERQKAEFYANFARETLRIIHVTDDFDLDGADEKLEKIESFVQTLKSQEMVLDDTRVSAKWNVDYDFAPCALGTLPGCTLIFKDLLLPEELNDDAFLLKNGSSNQLRESGDIFSSNHKKKLEISNENSIKFYPWYRFPPPVLN
ncbi:Las1-domain-containing protein [Rozella allomycis CSF55]|uniref:Las1-domain-containing protein n=1 Tax=Rozella allomycis (strain CSF55) TaxID=988480 RepID=A0A4P9YKH5_ROZAC|nr:Las1-domain-containing protein [Rozella allomycis CSF55]